MQKLWLWAAVAVFPFAGLAGAQSLGNAGTVEGTVTDPSGATVAGAKILLSQRITGFEKALTTDASGRFRITNIPPNSYHLEAAAAGFAVLQQDLAVKSAVPISLKLILTLASETTVLNVEASGADLLETVPYAHADVDRESFSKLPATTPGSGLSDAITLSSPGVVADSNGFFHPLGDHAQTSFSIDGQPISDQQSKQFSTQIPLNALQSMELISGAPPAEYGDKTSLVVNAVTRSGVGQLKPSGSFLAQYGSFGTVAEETTFALGRPKFGNFLVANALRSGRFLDTPEFTPLHAAGNSGTIFDRLDFQPNGRDSFHLNLSAARNWFQIPNTWDQQFAGQDQRQQVRSFNIAPGYQHTFGATLLYTFNGFLRQDYVNYIPSSNVFADLPATIGQSRRLRSGGFKTDVAYSKGMQNLKIGMQFNNTGLSEDTRFGVTDPNSLTGLIPFDLTRGGSLLNFRGRNDLNQVAFYIQDQINWRGWSFNAGLRLDRYAGLSSDTSAQPRLGVTYHIKPSATVLRVSYTRAMETPYNENLLLSSATGLGGLGLGSFGAYGSTPLAPGHRDQYNAGFEQALGKYLLVDADYFWKYTHNAYDFDTLFNTPIVFPISWRKSKIDGASIRLSTPTLHGFTAYTVMGHTRARFFGPENGGLIFNSPLSTEVFRIDHDQAFQQTTNAHYQFGKRGPWLAFTWRYDSGGVAGAVATLEDVLALTAAEQAAIGFYCGSQVATPFSAVTSCASSNYGAARVIIPAPGSANADHNPPRISPRHLMDLGIGTDNLFRLKTEGLRILARFTITNLANSESLYNFLSTFSGTHFVSPRAYQAEIGFVF